MKRTSFWGFLLGATLLIPGAASSQSVTVGGMPVGTIPDGLLGGPAQYSLNNSLDVNFDVPQLTGAITSISLSITMNHSWIGDLDVRLFKPGADVNDPAQGFIIFSRVGAQSTSDGLGTFGSSDHLGSYPDGPSGQGMPRNYLFSDDPAALSLWTAAHFDLINGNDNSSVDGVDIAPGSYRTSGAGPWDATDPPTNPGGDHNAGQPTSFTGAFSGLTPAEASGTWILRMRDGAHFNDGFVTEVNLTIEVPEPSHYAVLAALALIGFACYRRYSHAQA